MLQIGDKSNLLNERWRTQLLKSILLQKKLAIWYFKATIHFLYLNWKL